VQIQLQAMLDLQEAMNSKVNSNWRGEGFEWYRAIWIECAELMDHHGWKWWKKQTPDIEQVKLELIDIWHFGLSILLIKGESIEKIEAKLSNGLVAECEDFRSTLEDFVADVLQTKTFSIEKFAPLLCAAGMSFDELYIGYVGKNVLNFFRQDHGYKEGDYQKIWSGKEDNEHLVQIVDGLDTSSKNFKEDLYQSLLARYQELCA